MNIGDLNNPELQERLKAAKTTEELIALVQKEGLELTEEQLDAVAAGENLWDATHDDDCSNFEVCWTLGFSS